MSEETPGVEYYYKINPDYKVFAANSIMTTTTSDAQVKLDFCIESLAIPERMTFPTGDPSKLSGPINTDPEPRIQKLVQCGVLLTPEQTEIIAGLMLQLVDQIKKKRESLQKP